MTLYLLSSISISFFASHFSTCGNHTIKSTQTLPNPDSSKTSSAFNITSSLHLHISARDFSLSVWTQMLILFIHILFSQSTYSLVMNSGFASRVISIFWLCHPEFILCHPEFILCHPEFISGSIWQLRIGFWIKFRMTSSHSDSLMPLLISPKLGERFKLNSPKIPSNSSILNIEGVHHQK